MEACAEVIRRLRHKLRAELLQKHLVPGSVLGRDPRRRRFEEVLKELTASLNTTDVAG
jgi:hypothetical protein